MCGYVEKMQIHRGTEHDNNIIFQENVTSVRQKTLIAPVGAGIRCCCHKAE
jgi:hypothetical protein